MSTIESNYVVWASDVVKRACSVNKIVNLQEDYQLRDGAALGEAFTRAASCQLVDVDPKDLVLPDNLINTDKALIVSPRFKDFLSAKKLSDVEYLPFGLVDAKDKKISGTLFFVHPLKNPDCLDLKKCEPTYSLLDPEAIDEMNHIVFKTDPKRDLFRARGYGDVFFVSRSLAEAIHQAGFTGVRFWEIEGYLEHKLKIAFEAHVDMALAGSASVGAKSHYEKPPKECEVWIDTICKEFKQSKDGSSNFKVGGQGFIPQWGDDEWLDSFNEDDSPAFDPKRYHAIGFNGGSDYWLLDLKERTVVYFSHEVGYDETNCETVAKDWKAFAKQVVRR